MLDTHAHLDFPEFDADREQVVQRMHQAGISNLIIPGVSPEHWQKQLAVAQQYQAYFALGIHPWFCPEDVDAGILALTSEVTSLLECPRFVAIGECGLDALYPSTWPRQLAFFEAQLALAKSVHLPVIVHSVKTHAEVLACLKKYQLPRGGVIHAFSGSVEIAQEYIKLGFKLGIGGLIMNPNAKKLLKTVAELSLENFLLETDSPAMTPINVTEKRNQPANAALFIDKIATLQKKSSVLISEHLMLNAVQLFDL
ncbi:TatD family hydrolase [Shewanella sp. CG12_big_fil_rev_8_21_14_0_65_47_15]|uniref:TatD family hydrolase n=1 Tax=Shewanella sp. CG12_big_fil_rev_8_21_14_0_65_47_15 TaxID=1975537 RepID=UPI000CAAFB10|nr:TatD family hydrolase [Shewanella sp. CG12_big_fil_rev_8_21_14_0_65_47_15]PIW58965.1 MAG: TatD family deoxyribonuclease [Shewanella sp. CG12_big_fil_rev_8_21_14_0_65_47_15]